MTASASLRLIDSRRRLPTITAIRYLSMNSLGYKAHASSSIATDAASRTQPYGYRREAVEIFSARWIVAGKRVQGFRYRIQNTEYSIQDSVFRILYSGFCILYSVFCILYSVFCILYPVSCPRNKLILHSAADGSRCILRVRPTLRLCPDQRRE